jgi:probable rRNA maturation factor
VKVTKPLPSVTVRNLQSKARIDCRKVKRIVAAVVSGEHAGKPGTITVCFVNDRLIRLLNKNFHGRDTSTDVLAFDLGARPEFLADIIISTDTARVNAKRFRTGLLYESYLYVIHGILHLLGYDDATPWQRVAMRRRENHYLKLVNVTIPNPGG